MGWARKLPSGRYQGQYRGTDGKVRTADGGPFSHKAAAVRAAAEAEAEARAPGWRDPSAGLMTWAAWCEAWWPTRTVEASTLAADTGRRDNHLMPRWGAVALVDITRHDVKAWAAELRARGLSPATVHRIVTLLSASLAAAVDAEILQANAAARLRLPTPPASAERYLTREEFDAIAGHLEGQWLRMATLLVGTGARFGEAAGLHHARVDAGRGWVEIVETWDPARGAIKGYPKGRRRRQVPLPGWVDLGTPETQTCGATHPGCRSPLVVSSEAGTPMDVDNFRKRWDVACRRADVGHVRPHDLRHTYASWLLQAGISLAEVGRLLGHVSPTTTQRYAHLAETPAEEVLAALGRPRPRAANVQQPAAAPGLTGLRRGHLQIVR
jgi:integrase